MNFRIDIETQGYVVARFFEANNVVKIGHSSTYGDKLQELLTKVFFLRRISGERLNDFFPYSFDVLWEDDRVNYLWTFRMNHAESEVNLIVYELSPSDSTYRRIIVNSNLHTDELLKNVYHSLRNIFSEFGFCGYKVNWEVGNFPCYELIVLANQFEITDLLLFGDRKNLNWPNRVEKATEFSILSKLSEF
jgi:hypothetical protein